MDNCIYAIKDTETDHIIYIGRTNWFKKRHDVHFRLYPRSKRSLVNSFMKQYDNYTDRFVMYKLLDNLTIEEATKKEKEFIIKYKPDCNRVTYDDIWLIKNWFYLNIEPPVAKV